MKTAVLGATGYTGQILLRILAEHPDVEQIVAASSSRAGAYVRTADPGLPPGIEAKIPGGKLVTPEEVLKGKFDVVFSALPHLKSAEIYDPTAAVGARTAAMHPRAAIKPGRRLKA